MIRTGFLIFGFSYSQQRNDFGQADVAPLYLTGSEKELEGKAVYARAKVEFLASYVLVVVTC